MFFEDAWRLALIACPPRGRDLIAGEKGEVSLVDAMHGYCRDAWCGFRPLLARFNGDLLADLELLNPGMGDVEEMAA